MAIRRNNKTKKIENYLSYSSGMRKHITSALIRRLLAMEKMLEDEKYDYDFDIIFDIDEDDNPTAVFTVQAPLEEDNMVRFYISDLRSVVFYGEDCCMDIYSADEFIETILRTDKSGMGLEYFSPAVVYYDDDMCGISLSFALPTTVREDSTELTEVLSRLLRDLFSENRKFAEEAKKFLDEEEPEAAAGEQESESEDDDGISISITEALIKDAKRCIKELEAQISKLEDGETEAFPFS